MKAMVLERQGPVGSTPLRWREDWPEPQAAPGQVRVKVSVCALCRTDLHIVEGDLPARKMPVVPGHQIVGVVDQLGPGCRRLRRGQRVGIAWLRQTDGTCKFCTRGRENLCITSRYTGYDDDGGYAHYATVAEDFAYELPEALDDMHAAPLLCAGLIGYRALLRADLPPHARLLLVGFGSSAHIVLQIALHRGHEVLVVSRSASHQRLGLALGAAWAGDTLAEAPGKVDSAILFAPTGALVGPVLQTLERGGTLSIAGIHLSDVPALNYEQHLYYEKQVRSVTANTREDARAFLREAIEARVQPQVQGYRLKDANRALQDMHHSRIDGTGVLVVED